MALRDQLKVLVVDDMATSRGLILNALDSFGITQVEYADNGLTAMHQLKASPAHLVISDYNMPEMDGRELTEYIRTQSWQAEVPILMVTSEQNMGRLAAVERAGVSAICDKPFEAGNIRRLISDVPDLCLETLGR